MKKQILIAVTLVAPVVSVANFQGDYICKGNDLESNQPYELTISFEKSQDTYRLKCEYENVLYDGTAFYDRQSHTLPAMLVNPNDYQETTLIIFHPQKNNHLYATWTYLGKTTIAQAKCIKR
ncbi:MAG: hypothetical protein AB7V32_00425 [Candidatus Berkiella sp.]